jgi:predicted RNase H-like nuclease (RuvC/YqgF family)
MNDESRIRELEEQVRLLKVEVNRLSISDREIGAMAHNLESFFIQFRTIEAVHERWRLDWEAFSNRISKINESLEAARSVEKSLRKIRDALLELE